LSGAAGRAIDTNQAMTLAGRPGIGWAAAEGWMRWGSGLSRQLMVSPLRQFWNWA
jgi:hypothetical protein